jgi:hypothetical protein
VIVENVPLVATAANSQGKLGVRNLRLSYIPTEMPWSEARCQNARDVTGPHVKSSSYCMYRQMAALFINVGSVPKKRNIEARRHLYPDFRTVFLSQKIARVKM